MARTLVCAENCFESRLNAEVEQASPALLSPYPTEEIFIRPGDGTNAANRKIRVGFSHRIDLSF